MLSFRDWEPVHFEPSSEYWREEDDYTHSRQEILFGLHLFMAFVGKFHEI